MTCLSFPQDLYGVAFSVCNETPPFGLCTSVPQKQIPLQASSLTDFGLCSGMVLNVEPEAIQFDPLVVFSSDFDQVLHNFCKRLT